jgi:hypothetical protein
MIVRSDSYIDHICGHNWFTNQVTDERQDAYGSGALSGIIIPRKQPLLSVQKLEYLQIGGTWILGFQGDPGDPTNITGLEPYYVYLAQNKVVWHKLRLDGRQRYRISYTWGYPNVPDDIRDFSMSLAAREVILFWGGQFGPQDDITKYESRLNNKIARLTMQVGHRVSGVVA